MLKIRGIRDQRVLLDIRELVARRDEIAFIERTKKCRAKFCFPPLLPKFYSQGTDLFSASNGHHAAREEHESITSSYRVTLYGFSKFAAVVTFASPISFPQHGAMSVGNLLSISRSGAENCRPTQIWTRKTFSPDIGLCFRLYNSHDRSPLPARHAVCALFPRNLTQRCCDKVRQCLDLEKTYPLWIEEASLHEPSLKGCEIFALRQSHKNKNPQATNQAPQASTPIFEASLGFCMVCNVSSRSFSWPNSLSSSADEHQGL